MNDKRIWVIKSIPNGVVQLCMGAWSTREQAEQAIPEYNKKYYGVDYMTVDYKRDW